MKNVAPQSPGPDPGPPRDEDRDRPLALIEIAPHDRASTNVPRASANDAGPPLPAALTVDEVAGLLRLDRKTVYNLIARKEIPGVLRLGRAIRLSRDAVLQWLRDGQGRAPRSGRSR